MLPIILMIPPSAIIAFDNYLLIAIYVWKSSPEYREEEARSAIVEQQACMEHALRLILGPYYLVTCLFACLPVCLFVC